LVPSRQMRSADRQLIFPDSHLNVATVAKLESRMTRARIADRKCLEV
jgi:hypothetical protein